jgi:hypothetical protein
VQFDNEKQKHLITLQSGKKICANNKIRLNLNTQEYFLKTFKI